MFFALHIVSGSDVKHVFSSFRDVFLCIFAGLGILWISADKFYAAPGVMHLSTG